MGRLLKYDANVNQIGGLYKTALQAVASTGCWKVVVLLLHVNIFGGRYHSALQAACASGSLMIVQMLIEKGSDVNAAGGQCGTALQAAALYGHEKILRILLRNGADWKLANRDMNNRSKAEWDRADEFLRRALELHIGEANIQHKDAIAEECRYPQLKLNEFKESSLQWNVESIPDFDAEYIPPEPEDASSESTESSEDDPSIFGEESDSGDTDLTGSSESMSRPSLSRRTFT